MTEYALLRTIAEHLARARQPHLRFARTHAAAEARFKHEAQADAVEAEQQAESWAKAAVQTEPLDIAVARLAIREWIRAQGQRP